MEQKIKVNGIAFLEPEEKVILSNLIESYEDKISRMLPQASMIEVSIKEYKKDNIKKRRKYSLKLEIISGMKVIESSYADWDLKKAARILFQKAINEIEKKFHSSDQHKKARKPKTIEVEED
jgi:hypothetical protein